MVLRTVAPLAALCLIACAGQPRPASGPPAPPRRDPLPVAPAPVANSAPAAAVGELPPAAQQSIAFGDSGSARALEPIFPGAAYEASLPHPDLLLRQPLGTFAASHEELLACVRALAAASERVRVESLGRTHEGRELICAVVSSPANLARLDAIRAALARLADPRGLDAAEAQRLTRETPAVAWLGYSIHGDELSGSDASLAVLHHLAAGTGADVLELLERLVVVIDPCLNPDGRQRILSQLEQGAGYVPNLDVASMSRGRWPHGRGNHYLFDLNRDWIWGTQPETRARWAALRSFRPQLVVDAHEMGPFETYLFYPAADPLAPRLPEQVRRWWPVFAADQARAFDRHGWSYYTREWADSWYPGYTDAWGCFQGAIGILYEQARYMGQALRQPTGQIVTYREAVQRQAASSIANLRTLAEHRQQILEGYLEGARAAVAEDDDDGGRALVLVPGRDAGRERRFVERLLAQGIEIWRAEEEFEGTQVVTALSGMLGRRTFPPGALLVRARQPLGALVEAALGFDPRYDQAALDRERRELERKQRSRVYDVTAWSPVHAFDLDGSWCRAGTPRATLLTALPEPPAGLIPLAADGDPVYGWAVDGQADAAVRFAAAALELGLQLNLSDEPFRAAGRAFARGSLLVRRHENEAGAQERVARAALAAGAQAFALGTARSPDDGPDLGGQHFRLLARPRVALLGNAPLDPDAFGHVWHLVDAELRLPCALLDVQRLGGQDLRRYNVIVAAEGAGAVLAEQVESLRTWVRGGGTLIAIGSSAAALAGEEGLSGARLHEEVLADLPRYARAVALERAAGAQRVDAESVYGDAHALPRPAAGAAEAEKPPKDDEAKELDRLARLYSPAGVLLRGEIDTDAWITAGCRDELAVFCEGSLSLRSAPPVRTAVRLAAAGRLRVSGLLWPEARARLADAAWCTLERAGAGQVILFASSPAFRGWFPANGRLLANAIVYGPGAGARQPSQW